MYLCIILIAYHCPQSSGRMTSRPSTNMYSKGFSSGFVTDVNVVEVTSCRQRQPVKVCAEGPSGPRTVRRPRHHQSKINYEELVQSCHIKIIAMANHIMMNYDQGHHTTTSNPKVRPFQSCYIYVCVCVSPMEDHRGLLRALALAVVFVLLLLHAVACSLIMPLIGCQRIEDQRK